MTRGLLALPCDENEISNAVEVCDAGCSSMFALNKRYDGSCVK